MPGMCQSIKTTSIGILRISGSQFSDRLLAGRNRVGSERKSAQRVGQNLAGLRIVIHHQGAYARQVRNELLLRLASPTQCRTRP